MRHAAVCLVLVVGLTARAQQPGETILKPSQEWDGYLADMKFKDAPPGERIANENDFTKLWKALRPREDPPKVDFKQELVFAYKASGPNIITMNFRLSNDGDLVTNFFATERAGPGFAYRIVTIPRKGIKSINLHPLE